MDNCVFCKIIKQGTKTDILYADRDVIAFSDHNPVAPIHLLIVPRRHIPSVNELSTDDEELMGHLFTVAKILAEQEKILDSGYRLILNTGENARQSVPHLHMHLLGGMKLPTGLV